MVITHHCGQCFKVTFGDVTLVFDPVSRQSKLPAVRFGADIALVSRKHPDMNGVGEVASGGKTPFVIDGPGEYEKEGVTVQGFLSKSEYEIDKNTGSALNTIYVVELEGMTLVHLGALSEPSVPHDAREGIDDVDVLFVPVGGNGVLDPHEASKIATFLEPKIIIPMHWSGMGESKALDTFVKEAGGDAEKVEKLTLKRKDLAGKSGAIMIITT